MTHIYEPVYLISGGASILWSPKSEIHGRRASVRELSMLVLCKTSERGSEALDLNGRLIESEVSYG